MPTESLVLSVLQILLDAAKTADQMKEKNGAAPVVENNHAVCNDNSVPSILRGIFLCLFWFCFVFLGFPYTFFAAKIIVAVHQSRSNLTGALLKEILKSGNP